jgi:hypothetical protein
MQKDILIQYIGKDKRYNVFEEGVDQDVMEYFHEFKSILTDDDLLVDDPNSDINELFETDLPFDYIKLLLVRLSNIENIEAYRALQAYADKAEGEIKKWAVIACQQSRALIEGSLTDDEKVFIISGLGGKANMLRYFAIINTPDFETITEWQADIIKKELMYSADLRSAEIEDIETHDTFVTVSCLLPVDKSVADFFKTTVDNINELGNFLSEIIVVTNTKKFSPEEVKTYLREGPEALFEGDPFDSIMDGEDPFGKDDSEDFYNDDFYDDDDDDF